MIHFTFVEDINIRDMEPFLQESKVLIVNCKLLLINDEICCLSNVQLIDFFSSWANSEGISMTGRF